MNASEVAAAQALAEAPALQWAPVAPTQSARVSQFYVGHGDDYYEMPAGAQGTIAALGGNDWVLGTDGKDTVDGGDGDDRLIGQDGDDILRGGAGRNALEGGRGNDVIVVGGSQDELLFRRGDGQDVVSAGWASAGEADSAVVRIRLQGFTANDALALAIGPQGIAFDGKDVLRQDFNHVRSEDFSVIAADGSHRVLDGQGGDDVLDSRRWRRLSNSNYLDKDGWWYEEDAYWLKGGDGNDTLYGAMGDTLDGGRGNDCLVQEDSSSETTIRLALGDGQDVWKSGDPYFDALDGTVFAFAADVDPGSVWVEWVRKAATPDAGYDLVLHYGNQGDRVTLLGVRTPEERGRETTARLRFADGTETLLHTAIAVENITPDTAGDDVILGTIGPDVIGSGEGNDRIVLDTGDTYVYHRGHGHDVIETLSGSIQLADVTSPSQVRVERSREGTLEDTVTTWRVSFADHEGTLQIRFTGVQHAPQLLLADGKPMPVRALPRIGTEGYDHMVGGEAHEEMHGLGGNDNLHGGAGDDLLVGGRGDDFLEGGEGSDVYVYERGDGTDQVYIADHFSSVDTLRLGAGILESDVSLVRQGDDLQVRVRGDSGSVWIRQHFWGRDPERPYDKRLDRIEFATGVVWDLPAMDALVNNSAINKPPQFKGAIPVLKAQAGSTFSYTVPANTIVDPNPWDAVNYTVKMPNGSAVPSWVSFDPVSRTLTAKPEAAHVGTLQFALWGADAFGYAVGQYVTLQVSAAQPAPAARTTALPEQPAGLSSLPAGMALTDLALISPSSSTLTDVRSDIERDLAILEAQDHDRASADWLRRLYEQQYEERMSGSSASSRVASPSWATPPAQTDFPTAPNQLLLASQIDALVQAMAAFSPPDSGAFSHTPLQQQQQNSGVFPMIAVGPF